MENYHLADRERRIISTLCVLSVQPQIGPQRTASREPKEEARERREREESSAGSCLERICIRTSSRMRATSGHVWLTPARHDMATYNGVARGPGLRYASTGPSQRKIEISGALKSRLHTDTGDEAGEGARERGVRLTSIDQIRLTTTEKNEGSSFR